MSKLKPLPATILQDADIDGVGQAVLSLTRELWVLKDRMIVLENVLEKNGINVSEAIEAYQPDEDMEAKLASEGAALIKRVLDSMAGL